MAMSLDGFIAGPNHELDWLESPPAGPLLPRDPEVLEYDGFMADVGALLMGRRTYDVVRGFGVPWPYGEKPVLVPTRRPLDAEAPATVRRVEGPIQELVSQALEAAGGKDVYLDGGDLIRQAADAGLIDDLTITVAPVALGAGIPLFAGLGRRYPLRVVSHRSYSSGMVQLRLEPAERPTSPG